jgi:hypothetical protein
MLPSGVRGWSGWIAVMAAGCANAPGPGACTDSYAAPIADTAFVVGTALIAGSIIASQSHPCANGACGAPGAGLFADRLDAELASAELRAVTDLAMACAHLVPAVSGIVEVRIDVAPDGTAQGSVTAAPDLQLGGCVARAVGQVRFPPTLHGGSFGYPLDFETAAAP